MVCFLVVVVRGIFVNMLCSVYTCISKILLIYTWVAVAEINRNRYDLEKTEWKEGEEEAGRLGSEGVNFLLFVYDPAHPQFEITNVLWDIGQLCLHLDIFGRTVKPCRILV